MISIYLTQELERHAQVIYYFCVKDSSARNTATALLRGLIWQITGLFPHAASHLLQYLDPLNECEHHDKQATRNTAALASKETLWSILLAITRDQALSEKPVYCFLDGIDECTDDRQWLAARLSMVSGSQCLPAAVRLAVVSREMLGFERFPTISLEQGKNLGVNRDIKTVISVRMRELTVLKLPNFESVKSFIESQLLDRAQGTFLWVGFAMSELMKCTNTMQVVEAIEHLPFGLEPLYARMIHRIRPEDRRTSARIIRWVAVAECALSINEIGEVINSRATSHITREQATEMLVRTCEPLISINGGLLSLIHLSAKDWLLRGSIDDDPVLEDFRVKSEEAHLEIFEFCLDQMLSGGPMARYARWFWATHARNASELAIPLFERRTEVFGGYCLHRNQTWSKLDQAGYQSIRAQFHHQHDSTRDPRQFSYPPPLHLACNLKLSVWAHRLLAENWWSFNFREIFTARDLMDRTALFIASHSGLNTVVCTLLNLGADPDARNVDGSTPLLTLLNTPQLTTSHATIIRSLLDAQADIDAQDDSGQTALYKASLYHGADIVRLLLGRGASVTKGTKEGRTALQAAVASLDLRKIEHLLHHGASCNAASRDGRTALHDAASLGAVDVVQYLLDSGAHANIPSRNGLTPLHIASYHVRESAQAEGGPKSRFAEVVRLLLDHGAFVDAIDAKGLTALHKAASQGDAEITEILVGHDANVTILSHHGFSTLHTAVYGGNLEVVRLLLNQGHEVDARTISGMTPLHMASQLRQPHIVETLLTRGADVNAREAVDGTALHYLARKRSHRDSSSRRATKGVTKLIARLLLVHGARLDLEDAYTRTVCNIATQTGQYWLANLLNEWVSRCHLCDEGSGCNAVTWPPNVLERNQTSVATAAIPTLEL